MAVISLKNVSYQYPLEEKSVIQNISYEFEQGKVYGLIGENESGKRLYAISYEGLSLTYIGGI